jgi:aminocarboxymuconate-semialdehyde decarboxylase
MTMPGASVIDFHGHFLPQSAVEAGRSGKPWHGIAIDARNDGTLHSRMGGVDLIYRPMYWESIDERRAYLRRVRVDRQVVSLTAGLFGYELSQEHAGDLARQANDELHEFVAAGEGDIVGLATLPMQDPAAGARELERAVRQLGMKGAVVGSHVNRLMLSDPQFEDLFAAAEELGAILLIHPVNGRPDVILSELPFRLRNLIGEALEITIAYGVLTLGGVLERHPKLRLCFAQGGGYVSFGRGRLDRGARLLLRTAAGQIPSEYMSRVWFDSLTYDREAFRLLVSAAGSSRVLLGTDYPFDTTPSNPVEWIEDCRFLTPDERAGILGGNAAELLGLPVTS